MKDGTSNTFRRRRKTFAGTNTSQDHVEDIQAEEKDFCLSSEMGKCYQECKCGDYDEGCVNCDRVAVKKFVRVLKVIVKTSTWKSGSISRSIILSMINKLAGEALI